MDLAHYVLLLVGLFRIGPLLDRVQIGIVAHTVLNEVFFFFGHVGVVD